MNKVVCLLSLLLLWLCLCCVVVCVAPDASSSIFNPVTSYGVVNVGHVTPLPNYDASGAHLHYVLNNLPIAETPNQELLSLTVLFYPNTDPAIVEMNMNYQLTLHVARPIDGSAPTDTTRTLTYVQSVTVDNLVSGQVIDVSEQHLQLQPGDLLALSVPNNAIFLRVGVNHVGLPVGYAAAAVPQGQNDNTFTGPFVAHVDGSTSDVFQLCISFMTRTYGTFNTPISPPDCFRGDDVFYTTPAQQVAQTGILFQVSVSCGTGTTTIGFPFDFGVGTAAPMGTPLNIRIKLYRGNALNFTGSVVAGIDEHITAVCGQTVTVTPIPILAHDYVLFEVDSSNSPYCIPLSATVTTGGASVFDQNGTPLATGGIQFPAFQFSFVVDEATIRGDPQFSGFQGQNFQFHGLPDEVFNLISSPSLQLNSHLVYLSHASCDYNDTLCFQHPGTYLDAVGFTVPSSPSSSDDHEPGDVYIKVVAGSHQQGLRVWMGSNTHDMSEIMLGQYPHGVTWQTDNTTQTKAILKYNKHGRVTLQTHLFRIEVTNSNSFFNLGVALLDAGMLRVGAPRHSVTDHEICHHDKYTHAVVEGDDKDKADWSHSHAAVEQQLIKKYHVAYPVHGLIGQTWRNVLVCGKHWAGSVSDYVVSDLFGSDYYYNFYKQ